MGEKWRKMREFVNNPSVATTEKLKTVLMELLEEVETAEQRAEQAERDRDKLAAVVKRWWHNGYEWKQSLRSRDGAIADFLIYSELSREDFDRLIGGGT